jgi:N-acetylglutamate synthase-like GNAT family acetyltransferase
LLNIQSEGSKTIMQTHRLKQAAAVSGSDDNVNIRGARISEIDEMLAIFADEVRAGRMLPRNPAEMRAHIDDWLVAERDGELVGCVSLVHFNDELCEVRSLAVVPEYRGNGLGGKLIQAAVRLAEARGMRRVLALTRAAPVFLRLGFQVDGIANYPEKVWRDCQLCPLRDRCDEIAVIYHLDADHSNGNGSR